MENRRVNICGIQIDNMSFDELVGSIISKAKTHEKPTYVVTPNAHVINLLQKDRYFREIYASALYVVPDGMSLVFASLLLGNRLIERVNGTNLFLALCEKCSEEKLSVFFLGGSPNAAELTSNKLTKKFPGLIVSGFYCPPLGFENDNVECTKIEELLLKTNPKILFLGLGSPKQEKWINEHILKIGIPVSIGIGISFDFVAGNVKRAPEFFQKSGLEWLYRLYQEPRKLWKRYLFGNLLFIYYLTLQILRQTTNRK